MDYDKQISSLFKEYHKNKVYIALSKVFSGDSINNKKFLVTCLNKLPSSSCCDFFIYNHKEFVTYTKKDWLSLIEDLNEIGRYTLKYFLESFTGFTVKELNEIGLYDIKKENDFKEETLLINPNIKIISFRNSPLMYKVCKNLGLDEKEIKEMGNIRLGKGVI